MPTDVEKKMQAAAKGGYRTEDLARHILQGQRQRLDRQLAEIIARTAVKMEKLTAKELECIEFAVDGILKANEIGKEPWVIADAPPESPTFDEKPMPAYNKARFKGTEINPVPLGGNHATERIMEIIDEIDET